MLAQSRAFTGLQVQQRLLAQILLAALFAVLIWLGANIKVEIGLVPFTAQLLFVVLAGLVLGSRLGAASVAAYVIAGLEGLPVFARGGGLAYLGQPTMGYLIGFIAAAWVTGRIAEGAERPGKLRSFLAALAGVAVIHVTGVHWLAAWYSLSPLSQVLEQPPGDILARAWNVGSWPFLVWDSLKALVAAAVAEGGRAAAGRVLGAGS